MSCFFVHLILDLSERNRSSVQDTLLWAYGANMTGFSLPSVPNVRLQFYAGEEGFWNFPFTQKLYSSLAQTED